MRSVYKKITALALALCLALGLAACGSGGGEEDGGGGSQLSGTVYVPRFIDLDLDLGLGPDEASYIDQSCTDGKNVYLLASVYRTDGKADNRNEIYRIPLDGGEPEKLENFRLPDAPEGYDTSYVYAGSLRAGAEGTLWVSVSTHAVKYDLPEDFDPETDQVWNYEMTDNLSTEAQVQLDSTGNVIASVDTTGLAEAAGVDYVYAMLFDKDGDLYVSAPGKIVVMDAEAKTVRFTLEDEELWGESTVLLSDGTVGAQMTVTNTADNSYSRQLRVIDKEKKNWGTGYELPSDAFDVYAGGGDYLFYYQRGETLYGYKADAAGDEEPGTRLLNWLEADMAVDDLDFFSFLEDGSLVVMSRVWGDSLSGSDRTLAVLTPTDRSTLPEKTVLTYAATYLDQEMRNRIIRFNRTSSAYRIEVKDYSEYNTEDDYTAGIQKLNTEVIAGNAPDIISVSSLPLRQYGAKGFLEDLWPYIDSDPDLGREKLMDRVLTAAGQDGKLYEIFGNFYITTVIGSSSVVGERMSWTLEDLRAALAGMPEGCAIFSESDTKDMLLTYVAGNNLDSFLDWSSGQCHFDSPEFKALLEFCNSFPSDFDWDNYDYSNYDDEPTRVNEGRQMLMRESLTNFQDIQMYKAIFNGDISFIGYPMEDGSVGSYFSSYNGVAMSSTCKDKEGAWSFMREILLPRYEDVDPNDFWGAGGAFPINKADFEWVARKAMTPSGYETDENGNQVLDEEGKPIETSSGGWSWGSVEIEIYATKQEEYDQIMALYNAVERMSGSDENVMEIVTEVAGSYFAGDRSLDDAAALIQNRVTTYVNEQL